MDEKGNERVLMQCQNKIDKLKSLLAANRKLQLKLMAIKGATNKRILCLEERGAYKKLNLIPDFTSKFSSINEVRIIPPALADQLYWKNSGLAEYNFVKSLNDNKHKKSKIPKKIEVAAQDLGSNPKLIDFIKQAAKYEGVDNGLELYRIWLKKNNGFIKKGTITKEMNSLIASKRKKYGDNWEKIGFSFNGIPFEEIIPYYQKNLSNIIPGKWTYRQNIELLILIQYFGYGKWAPIAKAMKIKSQFQVRERFCNILDPAVGINFWTAQEENYLLQLAEQFQYKWARLVRQVPCFRNKTDNALRRKFRNIMIKQRDECIDEFVKDKDLADSIKKFKQGYFNRRKTSRNQSTPKSQNLIKVEDNRPSRFNRVIMEEEEEEYDEEDIE